MNERPKIAIIGSGAIGCFYGARLAERGADVHFLMRSDLEVVLRKGLLIQTEGRELHLPKVNAYATTSEIGACDLVIIALKTTSNAALAQLVPPLLKNDTALLTLQNGLGNEELLAAQFGAERVMGGLCFICLNRVAPGVVEHYGRGTLSIGEFQRAPQTRTREIVASFQNVGIETQLAENLALERWRKLVWNVPFNGLSIAAGKITVDQILANHQLRKLMRDLMCEIAVAATKLGLPIGEDYLDFQIERTLPMGAYQPSSLIDYAANREVEVEAIWGEPLRRAQAMGCESPRLETLYFLLKQLTSIT